MIFLSGTGHVDNRCLVITIARKSSARGRNSPGVGAGKTGRRWEAGIDRRLPCRYSRLTIRFAGIRGRAVASQAEEDPGTDDAGTKDRDDWPQEPALVGLPPYLHVLSPLGRLAVR